MSELKKDFAICWRRSTGKYFLAIKTCKEIAPFGIDDLSNSHLSFLLREVKSGGYGSYGISNNELIVHEFNLHGDAGIDESLRIELDASDVNTITEMKKGSGTYSPYSVIDMRRLAQNYLATSARISTACIKSFMTKDGRL